MTFPGEVFDFNVQDSSLIGLLQKINSFTDVGFGGVLGIFFILVIAGPLFLIMRIYGNERAFPVTLLITSICGIFLRFLGLITDTVSKILIFLLVISVLMLIREQGKYE